MELTRAQHQAMEAARRALAMSLEESCGADQVLPLAVVAITGAFADIVAASAGARALIEVINPQLEQSGYRLVSVARN
jgi:hypothetical protein